MTCPNCNSDKTFPYGLPVGRERACTACGRVFSTPELCLPPSDSINPSHYKDQGNIECIDAMESMLSTEEFIGYLRGNSFKYRWRFINKNGVEDLRKAEWYEQRLLKILGE